MPASHIDIDRFRTFEQSLHRPDVCGSKEAVSALLADDFREFGSSGRVYDKAAVIDGLAKEAPAAYAPLPQVHDFAVEALAPDVVLVTYRSVRRDGDGQQRTVLRSSIWKEIGGKWLMLFHQGTVVPSPT